MMMFITFASGHYYLLSVQVDCIFLYYKTTERQDSCNVCQGENAPGYSIHSYKIISFGQKACMTLSIIRYFMSLLSFVMSLVKLKTREVLFLAL